MYKIPPTYHLRRALKSETAEDAVKHYGWFYTQMYTTMQFSAVQYAKAWKAYFDGLMKI